MQASVATKCSHFGMTERRRGRQRRQNLATIKDYTRKIAEALHVCGLMNMQYAIEDGKVFVLEANPRASRTMPLVSKVCNTPVSRRRLVLTSRRRREWSVSGTVCKCSPRNSPDARCQARRPEAQGQEVAETHAPRSCASKLARDARL